MASYIKIETNVPVVGEIQYADYAEGEYGRQIKLKGKWNGESEVKSLYLPESAMDKLAACGACEETDKEDRNGHPRIKVLLPIRF